MQLMLSLLALGYVALAAAVPGLPLHPGGIGGFFKGPNSETIIKGPDGSVITAAAEGGAVVAEPAVPAAIVASPAVALAEQAVAVATPAVSVAAPAIAVAAPVGVPVIEAVAVPAPVVESKQSSDLIGPSGRIVTKGSQAIISGPASTTVTGPAVVAETVVRGPPVVATPIAVAPLATISAAPIARVTATPIGTVTAASLAPVDISPVAVTASPIAASPLPLFATEPAYNRVLPTTVLLPPPQAVATASSTPLSSVASATVPRGGSATATATSKSASASVVDVNGAISTVTAIPQAGGPAIVNGIQGLTVTGNGVQFRPSVGPVLTSGRRLDLPELVALPVSSTLAPPVLANGIQEFGTVGSFEINDRVALQQDQLAIDNRQLNLNRAFIPAANIIPPEIAVTPRPEIGRGRPTPGTLLTTPGLGSVTTSTNIQREEGDISVRPTPSSLQLNGLTQEQAIALQNRQLLLNRQLHVEQQGTGTGLNQLINVTPNDGLLLRPNAERSRLGLANVPQQNILTPELFQSSVDASQLQLTNVPQSAVNNIPAGFGNGGDLRGINDGLNGNAYGRYGRETKAKKN